MISTRKPQEQSACQTQLLCQTLTHGMAEHGLGRPTPSSMWIPFPSASIIDGKQMMGSKHILSMILDA